MSKKEKLDGRTAKNPFEVSTYKIAKKSIPRGWRCEYEADKFPYVMEHEYTPDLTISRKDGTILYIEIKGLGRAFTPPVRAKMIAIKKQHPDKDIRILFYRDGRLDKRTKMTASQWATKYKFPFAIKDIPDEWLT